jgi:hypothetical protein
METNRYDDDWELLAHFFPDGWEIKAKELGAIQRLRKFNSVSDILRLLLIHLADGCSMREATARAKHGNLADISDVALLKRLRVSSEWFRWMSLELLKRRGLYINPPNLFSQYNVRSVDASVISEPGSTGTDWRLHYCIKLFGLQCDQFTLSRQDLGESFVNFKIQKNDLIIGDRAYGRLNGLSHVKNHGGFFIARLKNKSFKIYNHKGQELNLLDELKQLSIGEIIEIDIKANTKEYPNFEMRLCAIRKSDTEAEKSMRKAKKEQNKKQRSINPETIELHRYVILINSLPKEIPAHSILELYRTRWQIEIAFKRLKSILGLGHLPKVDEESCRAWLHGKMFVALLAQAIVDESHFFSPWGYPIRRHCA